MKLFFKCKCVDVLVNILCAEHLTGSIQHMAESMRRFPNSHQEAGLEEKHKCVTQALGFISHDLDTFAHDNKQWQRFPVMQPSQYKRNRDPNIYIYTYI